MPSWTTRFDGATALDTTPQGNVLTNAATGEEIALAMQRLHLSGRASPAGALLRVTHAFKAEGENPMEALYTFMLPRAGTLRRFIVKGEDFEMESTLSPRQEAREEYEEGVSEGHLSVLAETYNDGMVTLSVGQVRPGEMVTVMLDIVQGVDVEDEKFRLRFPFTLAPSYHAKGNATATEAGGKMELPSDIFGDLILPEWKNVPDGLHQVSFKIRVETGGVLDSVASPSHRVLVRPLKDGAAEIELAGSADVPNRDLVVDVKTQEATPTMFADEELVSKTTDKDDPAIPEKAPRWTLALPSSLVPKAKDEPRRVCFVVDRSGSMGGVTMERAKLACEACISALQPQDYFGLVAFDSSIEKFDKKMGKATDANRKQARKWLAGIDARGGTHLAEGLGAGVDVLGGPGGDIFLITDGAVYQTGPIVEQVAAAGTRVHVMGIGAASQDRFLEALGRRSGGVSKMVGVNEDVATTALDMFNAVRQPVQTDVEATVKLKGGKKKQEHTVGTIWDGRTILITDDGSKGKLLPVQVTLKWDGGKKVIKPALGHETPNGLVALLWAGRQIEDLESSLDMCGQDGPAKSAIERDLKEISTAYSLASRVMSLCAVVKRLGDQAGEQPEQKIVAVGTPENMQAAGVFGQPTLGMRSLNICASAGGGGFTSMPGVYTNQVVGASMSGRRSAKRKKGARVRRALMHDSLDSPVFGSSSGGSTTKGITPISENVTLCCNDSGPSASDGSDMVQDACFFLDSNNPCGEIVDSLSEEMCNLTIPPGADLVTVLANLRDDGGLDADDTETRITLTALLAIEVLKVSIEKDTSAYDMHLTRMVAFLEAHKDAENEDILAGVITLIENRQIKPYMMTHDYLVKATSIVAGNTPADEGWQMVISVGTSR